MKNENRKYQSAKWGIGGWWLVGGGNKKWCVGTTHPTVLWGRRPRSLTVAALFGDGDYFRMRLSQGTARVSLKQWLGTSTLAYWR